MIEAVLAIIAGALFGVGGTVVYKKQQATSGKHKAEKELAAAKSKAGDIVLKAKDEAIELENERRKEWKRIENRLADRETTLDKKLDELDKRTEKLRTQEDEVEGLKGEIREIRLRQQDKLEKIAKLSKTDAAEKLMQMTERDIKQDMLGLVNKIQKDAMDDAEDRARPILLTAMKGLSSEIQA